MCWFGFRLEKDLVLGTLENLKGFISCLANYFDRGHLMCAFPCKWVCGRQDDCHPPRHPVTNSCLHREIRSESQQLDSLTMFSSVIDQRGECASRKGLQTVHQWLPFWNPCCSVFCVCVEICIFLNIAFWMHPPLQVSRETFQCDPLFLRIHLPSLVFICSHTSLKRVWPQPQSLAFSFCWRYHHSLKLPCLKILISHSVFPSLQIAICV